MAAPSDPDLQSKQLYGGAFSCSIPATFKDVSSIREVPDNQEVFAHSSHDQSIIIELVEYQNVADDKAAMYHFQDLAESNASTQEGTKVHSVVSLQQDLLALSDCSCGWLLQGSQLAAKFNQVTKTSVRIHLILLRLPKFGTDVLITLNSPEEVSTESDTELILSVAKSLKLLNPSLFG